MKAFLNCPTCGTAGWTPISDDESQQIVVCPVCKTEFPLNHKAVEELTNG